MTTARNIYFYGVAHGVLGTLAVVNLVQGNLIIGSFNAVLALFLIGWMIAATRTPSV